MISDPEYLLLLILYLTALRVTQASLTGWIWLS